MKYLLLPLLAFMWMTAAGRAATPPEFERMDIELDPMRSGMFWAEIDGDGMIDLLVTDDLHYKIYYQQPGGIFGEGRMQSVPEPTGGALYDLADLDGDGVMEIIVLRPAEVVRYRYNATTGGIVQDAKPLIENLRGIQVQHVAPADALFDIDRDGDEDLVYPVDGRYYIFVQDGEGVFRQANQVSTRGVKVNMSVGAPLLRESISARIEIPRMSFEDLNGDGRLDLRVSNNNVESFFLQDARGVIPEEPSWKIDLTRYKEQVPKQSGEIEVDQFQFIPHDVNGDGVQDYVMVAGNKIWVYHSGPRGPDLEKPDQILKVSTQYMSCVLLPINKDDRPDLVIMKYEIPSLGRLIAGLAIGLRIEIEFLGYDNTKEGVFSRKPDHRSTFVFKVPPILKLIGELDSIATEVEGIRKRARSTAAGDFNGDGTADVVKLEAETLDLYLTDRPGGVKADFYSDYGGSELFSDVLFGKPRREVTLDSLLNFMSDLVNSFQDAAIEGRTATRRLPAGEGVSARSRKILTRDLNGDGTDEIIVFLGPKEGEEFAEGERQTLAVWMSKTAR